MDSLKNKNDELAKLVKEKDDTISKLSDDLKKTEKDEILEKLKKENDKYKKDMDDLKLIYDNQTYDLNKKEEELKKALNSLKRYEKIEADLEYEKNLEHDLRVELDVK